MELEFNPHVELLSNFYIKLTDSNTKSNKKEINDSINTIKKQKIYNGTEIKMDWKYEKVKPDNFIIPNMENTLIREDLSKLNNYSFVHSILYTIDNLYYTSNITQKLKDCKDFIEVFRSKIYKGKLNKEESDVIKNIENNIYTDNTIQSIVNYLNIFHLIILSNESPKLFINKKMKKSEPSYKTASTLVVIYYDTLREVYSPLEYNLDSRDTFYITWKEPEFMEFLKKVLVYNHSTDIKKWTVAELRSWITFFELNIDISLDKKQIIEKIGSLV